MAIIGIILVGVACAIAMLGFFLGSDLHLDLDRTISSHQYPLETVSNFNLRVDNRQQLLLDPKTVDARQLSPQLQSPHTITSDANLYANHIPYSERTLPSCNLQDVAIGRWTYEHHDAVFVPDCPRGAGRKCRGTNFSFKEADPGSATWTPLRCSLPHLEWRPSKVLECAAMKNIKNIVILGGSTSRYIADDFHRWIESGDDGSLSSNHANVHSKEQINTSIMGGQLHLEAIQQTSADPSKWMHFLSNPKFFENTLVLFNSVLWDMRKNDFSKYERDVNYLAAQFGQYKKDHPTNRVIWRASGTPNWNRLDVLQGSARAQERLLNPDAVMVYNTVAAEAMSAHGIETFDDYFMVLGRPEETRGPDDGLHPSTNMNLELMRLLLSVLCNE